MPCYEVRTMSVEFHAKNRRLLEKALDALGWTRRSSTEPHELVVVPRTSRWAMTLDLATGLAVVREDQQHNLNTLKQQYSREALRRAAKLQGWQVKSKTQMKGVLRR